MVNKFSAPIPFTKRGIEKLSNINSKITKSQINVLYGCLPANSKDKIGFEQSRNLDGRINDFSDFFELVKYAFEKGFEFIYLLNSPETPSNKWLIEHEDELNDKLEKLLNFGIKKIRVCNTLVIDYICSRYPEFDIYLSTSQEYFSLNQFKNLFKRFSNIKGVVLSFDLNKNFYFIQNFHNLFPNVELELMVNEGCLNGCPFRKDHNSFSRFYSNGNNKFFNLSCSMISNMNKAEYICLCNVIYPWQIFAYNEYKTFNFKFVGRNDPYFYGSEEYLAYYEEYLLGIDDFQNIKNVPLIHFNNYLVHFEKFKNLIIGDIIKYIPDINYFVKYGHLCSFSCGVTCNYCYECSIRMNNVISVLLNT